MEIGAGGWRDALHFLSRDQRVCIFDLLGISEGNATQGAHSQRCCFVSFILLAILPCFRITSSHVFLLVRGMNTGVLPQLSPSLFLPLLQQTDRQEIN